MSLEIPAISSSDSAGSVAVNEAVFGQDYNEALIHQMVVWYLAGARSGTRAQKTRSEVSGGGAKPWRQKGNGRARAGTNRSPIWRTGGVTFAAKPQAHQQKLNKKMYRAGLRSIFSELLRQDRLVVSNDLRPNEPKTKELYSKLKGRSAKRTLIVLDQVDRNLELASRNLKGVGVCTSNNLNPAMLVSSDLVVLTTQTVKYIEEHLA